MFFIFLLLLAPPALAVPRTYPSYCSKLPDFVERPRIPPLPSASKSGVVLLSSSVFIRHGARTPYDRHFCWEGYSSDAQQSKWDCDSTIFMGTSSATAGGVTPFPETSVTFNLKYDAYTLPNANALGGDCHVGQLLTEGISQQAFNGQSLASSYIAPVDSDADSGDLLLFGSSSLSAAAGLSGALPNSLYLRGDDEQRTLQSGQVLVQSMFDDAETEPVQVDWHIGDYAYDPLYPNARVCPRLADLQAAAVKSSGYEKVMKSQNVAELDSILAVDLGGADWSTIMDCQMTNICTDRPLPSAIDDFTGDGDGSVFSRLVEHASWLESYVMLYDSSAYAKLSMAPIFAEFAERCVYPARLATSKADLRAAGKPLLSVYSGHDTTIMPMLAALGVWDGGWAPYASLLAIELYYVKGASSKFPSSRAFRIVYDGEVLTGKFKGCEVDNELCDFSLLDEHLKTFAKYDSDCESKVVKGNADSTNLTQRSGSVATPTSTWVLILFLVTSASSFGTAWLLLGKNVFLLFGFVIGRTSLAEVRETSGQSVGLVRKSRGGR